MKKALTGSNPNKSYATPKCYIQFGYVREINKNKNKQKKFCLERLVSLISMVDLKRQDNELC